MEDRFRVGAADLITGLAADGHYLDGLALAFEPSDLAPRLAHDGAVEAAAEAAVRRDDEQQVHVLLAGTGHQLRTLAVARHVGGERLEHTAHALGKGATGLGLLLRAAELGGGDHLHGGRDLLRRLDAGDPVLKVLKAWHSTPSSHRRLDPCLPDQRRRAMGPNGPPALPH